MSVYYTDQEVTVHHGDCVEVMRTLPDASVDAVVTDPPYLLSFMGREWDTLAAHQHIEWHGTWASECLRVLKPGGHLLAFGGTRTHHRLACAIEDAGFEIRDSITWLYASGFPKSLDVSKAIDRAAGTEREVVGQSATVTPRRVETSAITPGGSFRWGDKHYAWRDLPVNAQAHFTAYAAKRGEITAPATPDAQKWAGFGTALKPASEPIVVARKPLSGTVAQTVLAHGTGALNIDATRVGMDEADRVVVDKRSGSGRAADGWGHVGNRPKGERYLSAPAGRWPSNVVLSHAEGCEQTGTRRVRSSQPATFHAAAAENNGNTSAAYGKESRPEGHVTPGYGDADGLETVPTYTCAPGCPVAELDRQSGTRPGFATQKLDATATSGAHATWDMGERRMTQFYDDTGGASRFFPTFRYQAKAGSAERPVVDGEAHSTVKPLALMRWLAKLVTPPGGTILDPFAGSGTTAEAAILEGFRCITIERDETYLPLIRARITKPLQVGFDFEGGAA